MRELLSLDQTRNSPSLDLINSPLLGLTGRNAYERIMAKQVRTGEGRARCDPIG